MISPGYLPRAAAAPARVIEPETWLRAYPTAGASFDDSALPIALCTAALRRHWWKIALFSLMSGGLALYVCSTLPRVYEAAVTLDVDRTAPEGVIGKGAAQEHASSDMDVFLTTQVELLQSDSVLRPVAQRFVDRDPGLRTALQVSGPEAWTGLKVTRVPNTFLIRIKYRSNSPQLSSEIANAIAHSYVEQSFLLRSMAASNMTRFLEQQLGELKGRMDESMRALMRFEGELNVIDPEQKASILSARLLQLNTEYTAAQSSRIRKEVALEMMNAGSAEAVHVASLGQELASIAERMQVAREQFATATATYGTKHPEYAKAFGRLAELKTQSEEAQARAVRRAGADYSQSYSQEHRLEAAVREVRGEFDRLKGRSLEYQNLKRSAEEDKKLYDELIRKIREAGINAGYRSSAIRIADKARPSLEPASPNSKLIVVLSTLASFLVGVVVVVGNVGFDKSIRSPEQLVAKLNIPVIGMLPPLRSFETVHGSDRSTVLGLTTGPGRRADREGFENVAYQEAIRLLRNSILLQEINLGKRVRSVLITSAVPGEGKSSIAGQLALANSKHRSTLLIDADLRRSSLSERFGLRNRRGLADALTIPILWQRYAEPLSGYQNIDFLPAGLNPVRASDLIGPTFKILLDEVESRYELVVIDAPPILGFAETLEMATKADGVLLVSLFGATDQRMVENAMSTLGLVGANLLGVALNRVPHEMSYLNPYQSYAERTPRDPGGIREPEPLVQEDVDPVEAPPEMTKKPVAGPPKDLAGGCILGMRVDRTSYDDAVSRIVGWVQSRTPAYVCVATVHMVMEAHDVPAFRQVVNEAALVTPDGMPLVWCLRRLGLRDATRVYGPDLTPRIVTKAAELGIPVGFYGGTENSLNRLTTMLRESYPALRIAYAYAPPFRPLSSEEDQRVEREIIDSGVRIVFVGLGCPKQEQWMADHVKRLDAVLVGVGAAFDFLTKTKPQAPRWMMAAGLEWVFRLATEPRRLWRRYLKQNPRFVMGLVQRRMGLTSCPEHGRECPTRPEIRNLSL